MRKLIQYKLIIANGNILDKEFGETYAKFVVKIHTSMQNGWELYDNDCFTNNKNIMWQAMVKYEEEKCAN
jgi:hypothetical protein